MAVHVAPERRRPVQVPPSLGVEQVGALAALDHQRLLLAPPLLLGEGVPDVVAIELSVVGLHRSHVSPGVGGSDRSCSCSAKTEREMDHTSNLCPSEKVARVQLLCSCMRRT